MPCYGEVCGALLEMQVELVLSCLSLGITLKKLRLGKVRGLSKAIIAVQTGGLQAEPFNMGSSQRLGT